jgi:predicted transcriptional regulator
MFCKTTIDILKFLKDSKVPVSYRIIRRYLRKYDRMSIHNALKNLYKKQLICKTGHKKSYLYSISSKGLDYLWFLDTKSTRDRLIQDLDNYLLKAGDTS